MSTVSRKFLLVALVSADSILLTNQELQRLDGCWADSTCPPVDGVVMLLVQGTARELNALRSSPLVDSISVWPLR